MDRADIEADMDAFDPEWDEPDDYDGEPVTPTTTYQVNGMLRARRAAKELAAEYADSANTEINRLIRWRDDRLAGLDRKVEWLDRSLEGFMRQANAKDPKTKTLYFPNGDLTLRAARGHIEIEDAQAFVAWCIEHGRPDLIRIPEPEPAKGELAKLKIKAGLVMLDEEEFIPGVEFVTPPVATFDVKEAK